MESSFSRQPPPQQPGASLKALRHDNGWTLAQVSERTGLTISTLSKVENGKLSMSYDKMVKIATGLGIDMGVRFASPQPARVTEEPAVGGGRRSVTRRGEGRKIESASLRLLYPAADLLKKQLVPGQIAVLTTAPADQGELIGHPGEEYIFVLKGSLELRTTLYAPVILEEGDSIYFDSMTPHLYVAAGGRHCEILCVLSTADWGHEAHDGTPGVELRSKPQRPEVVRKAVNRP